MYSIDGRDGVVLLRNYFRAVVRACTDRGHQAAAPQAQITAHQQPETSHQATERGDGPE